MADVLQQIQALLRHACENQNLDEARNAALALARLIKKHNITLVLPAANNGTSFPPPRPAPVRPPPRPQPARPKPARAVPDDWQKMKAKYPGECKWCRRPIKPNTPIYWSKDHGAYHPVCFLKSE